MTNYQERGNVGDRYKKLQAFLAFLRERINFNFNRNSFEDRVRLQKYVHVAKFCGLDLGYKFVAYLNGPYSYELVDDCFKADAESCGFTGLDSFDSEKFVRAVKGRDLAWLIVATTILSVKENNPGISEDRLVEIAAEIENVGENDVKKIFFELRTTSML
jgi:uncharacterized protein YwgA